MSDKTNGDYVLVPRKTLEWWLDLATINPSDLPPRITTALSATAPAGGVDDGLLNHMLPQPSQTDPKFSAYQMVEYAKRVLHVALPRPAFDEAEAREILAQVLRDRHVYGENKAVSLMNGAVIPINTNDALDFARRMSTHHSRDGVIEALRSALVRTQANFDLAVRGKPVRDMAENLAENFAALELADRAQSQQKKQG